MNSKPCCLSIALLLLMIVASGFAGRQQSSQSTGSVAKPDRRALEEAFKKRLTGSVLIGAFTVDGQNNAKPLHEERYEIETVKKLKNDYWVFVARLKYRRHDVKLPITLKVLWAGDTPIVSLTDLAIPGLSGTFTTRVMFYRDRYAGTWQHDKAGGHMFGKIETIKKPEAGGKKEAK